MSEIEPKQYEASVGLSFAPAIVAAVVIAAGGVYFILDRAAPILAAPAEALDAPPRHAEDRPSAPTAQPPAQVAVPPSPAVYRCTVNGTTTYSDAPCRGAKVVDARPAAGGFVPTPVRRPVTVTQASAGSPHALVTSATASEKSRRDAHCEWIEKAIEDIDAQARRGQTAAMQDRLREDRAKLVDERYALKC